MIFVGDIAIPYADAVEILDMPLSLKNKTWFGNFEGAIEEGSDILRKEKVVFNDKKAIRLLVERFNFAGFALANNHIFDTGSYDETVGFFRSIRIPYCGIGNSLAEASLPLVLNEGNNQIVILNFGWEVIQCKVTTGTKTGVNPLTKKHVLKVTKDNLNKFPNALIIVFMHWSYELESEPQPFERELAKKLIDMGVSGIIGCHPHRVGGLEFYKGKPIVYSLGNWMFKQNYFHNGKLKFPDFCNRELALEWDFEKNEMLFHFFNFDRETSSLSYLHTDNISDDVMNNNTPYRSLSDNQYKKWYRKNHYHKGKGLPIYYWEDPELLVVFKNLVNKCRDFLISFIVKFR